MVHWRCCAHLTHQPPFDRSPPPGRISRRRPRRDADGLQKHRRRSIWSQRRAAKDPVNSAPHHAVVKAALAAMTLFGCGMRAERRRNSRPSIELGDHAARWIGAARRTAGRCRRGGNPSAGSEAPTATRSTAAPTARALRSQRPARPAQVPAFLFGGTRGCSTTAETLKSQIYPTPRGLRDGGFAAAAAALRAARLLAQG